MTIGNKLIKDLEIALERLVLTHTTIKVQMK